jgi:hypothetical protein
VAGDHLASGFALVGMVNKMRTSKECLECGGIYFRGEHVNQEQWEARRYCSSSCGGKALVKRMRAAVKETADAGEPEPEPPTVPEPGRLPITRDLKVVRVGPNPRTVTCEYFELAQRRTCTVLVKRNVKFVRGMSFRMAEPAGELEFSRPWVYSGPAPRRRGRW